MDTQRQKAKAAPSHRAVAKPLRRTDVAKKALANKNQKAVCGAVFVSFD